MSDPKSLFALADRDDAVALLVELGDTPTYRVRSESGETLFLHSLYRGKTKCVDALQQRGGLTLHEAAAAGDVQRIDELIGRAPWTIQSLSADGWTALHLAAFVGPRRGGTPLARTRRRRAAMGARVRDQSRDSRGLRRPAAGQERTRETRGRHRRPRRHAETRLHAIDGSRRSGYTDAIDVLLAAGADRSRRHPDGKTAADFAREKGHRELIERLS